MQDTPDSELDSGISVNGNYDEPRQKNDPPEIYERIDELQSSEGKKKASYSVGLEKSIYVTEKLWCCANISMII